MYNDDTRDLFSKFFLDRNTNKYSSRSSLSDNLYTLSVAHARNMQKNTTEEDSNLDTIY